MEQLVQLVQSLLMVYLSSKFATRQWGKRRAITLVLTAAFRISWKYSDGLQWSKHSLMAVNSSEHFTSHHEVAWLEDAAGDKKPSWARYISRFSLLSSNIPLFPIPETHRYSSRPSSNIKVSQPAVTPITTLIDSLNALSSEREQTRARSRCAFLSASPAWYSSTFRGVRSPEKTRVHAKFRIIARQTRPSHCSQHTLKRLTEYSTRVLAPASVPGK